MTTPTLGELVEVAEVDTVVRLDGPGRRLGELVLTGDVVDSLSAVLAGASGSTGAGFFVVGPFGSGKSHFLAALGELVTDPLAAGGLPGWDASLRHRAAGARASLAIGVPLVEYRAEARLEDVVARRAWRALHREPAPTGADRSETWDGLLASAQAQGHAGVAILLDELSEFLRAKQGAELTEDLRFLQFLGEWAGARPVLVAAALQESIEEVANVSQRELARIRDRYRPGLTLSMRHVEDLVRGRLVRLRPGAEQWVTLAQAELEAAFPASRVEPDAFARCYPLHPDTLGLLEGLRFVLSQQRGVVDFVCRQLRTDLGRPYDHLVTPDQVYDHFRERLHERHETARLADTVVPYFERAAPELLDSDDVDLALRAVKLCCLLAASPLERPRTAAELAGMLQARVSDLEPAANVSYLEQAVLAPLARRGAYLIADPGPPVTYRVEVGADAALVAEGRVAQARSELSPDDRRVIATLVKLGSLPALPLQVLAEVGTARREMLWHNTLRSVVVGTGRVLEMTPADAEAMVSRAATAGAEGCLLVAEVEGSEGQEAAARARALTGATDRLTVWAPAVPSAEEQSTMLDFRARVMVAEAALRAGDGEVAELLARSADADAAQGRELLRRLYFDGEVIHGGASVERAVLDLPSLSGLPFERQLPSLVDPLLSGLHPLHRQVAPRGELVGERLVRRLVHEVIAVGRLSAAAMARGQLRPLIEGYLVPLGLARVRADGATVAPDPVKSLATGEVLRLVGDAGPVTATDVAAGLADGPLGLTAPESVLVINACVQAGLVELRRGRSRLEEPFVAVSGADRLYPGELVDPAVRVATAGLAPITGTGPFDPWSTEIQRASWHAARAWLEARREDVAQARAGLASARDIPALGGADTGAVLGDARAVAAVLEACPADSAPAVGLAKLAGAVADGPALLAAAGRLAALARFLRDDLRRLDEAAAYLTHPDLAVPDDDAALASLRDSAIGLLAETFALAAAERTGEVFAALREFRGAYAAAYVEAHDRFYAAVDRARAEPVRSSPAYRALRALSAVGAVAVPDDRVKVDRALVAALPVPCRRRVDMELAWKPRCACGLPLGAEPPVLDAAALVAIAERGVGQYLVELGRPETLDRLGTAAADLDALGRDGLASSVRSLAALAADGDAAPDRVAGVLGGEDGEDLSGVLRDVLTGGQLIVTRDLADLREDLIGRRYPKRRLLDLLAAWVDPAGDLPGSGFVEVADSTDSSGGTRLGTGPEVSTGAEPSLGPTAPGERRRPSATITFVGERFPGLSPLLPDHQGADAFWLAAWWTGRASPPSWLPSRLLAETVLLGTASLAAIQVPEVRAELADLDSRIRPGSVLGEELAAAMALGDLPKREVAAALTAETLLRHPVRLAANELLRRVPGDWPLAGQIAPSGGPSLAAAIDAHHALVCAEELAALACCLEAAGHLAELERRLADTSGAELVAEIYPSHYAPVAALISQADAAAAGESLIDTSALDAVRSAAGRLLRAAEDRLVEHANAGFPDNLPVWDIGRSLVQPLLTQHNRVAVLLIDAMRADLAARVGEVLSRMFPRRPLSRHWAVLPAPTRTVEAVAALSWGRPVPAGSAGQHPDSGQVPFSHLGFEAVTLVGADRDHNAAALQDLWTSGPPISVAVATSVDERLHRTSADVAALLDEACTGLRHRVLPSLTSIPRWVPIVVLADHGFRENPTWGRGPEGRYTHGGTSLEECVVPVLVLGPQPPT
ncbi:MAG: DUF6079 family protein [Actinomycetota bacterium]|nr:DUF6079 family protein [Actinomycetota bacterium]